MNVPLPWAGLQRLTRERQDALQLERLKSYLSREVLPFSAHYRRVFAQARLDPSRLRSLDELRRIPPTTKQDLLEAQSDPQRRLDFVLVPSPELVRAHWPLSAKLGLLLGGSAAREKLRRSYTPSFVTFTTGRSSDPVVFSYTPHDLAILGKVGARMLDVHGIRDPLARIANVFPFAPHLAFWQAAFAGFETGRLMLSTGGGKVMGTAGNIRLIAKLQPTVLIGTPGYVHHLLREAAAQGTRLTSVVQVVLGAEKTTPGLKQKMGAMLAQMGSPDVRISGTYGFTEARMAFSECPASHDATPGYHVYPDTSLFEVVDPETLEPVGEGESGELLYTPLAGHGTVVLRYRTGDLAVNGILREPCPFCGRTLPRIGSELRRSSDRKALDLTKIKGTLVDLSALGSLLSDRKEVDEWQVVLQKQDGDPYGLDEFLLRIALRPGFSPEKAQPALLQAVAQGIEVSPSRIEFMTTPELIEHLGMETQMKEQRFLDLRPK